MPDKPIVPTPETSDPERVARAVRDLTSSISRQDGGWNDRGYLGRPGKWDEKLQAWIITYTMDTKAFQGNNQGATNLRPFLGPKRYAVQKVLAEIEKVSNITFVHATHHAQAEKADIRFGEADDMGDSSAWAAHEKAMFGKLPRQTDVILNMKEIKRTSDKSAFEPGGAWFGTLTHEVMHALRFSHPGADGSSSFAGGNNHDYSRQGTVMSYNYGGTKVFGLKPFDVAALQARYGKPRRQPRDRTIPTEELPATSTVYAEGQATIDMRNSMGGELEVDLSTHQLGKQIQGRLKRPGHDDKWVDAGIAPGTRVAVVADDTTQVRLRLTGRKDAELHGGARNDYLIARGGNNRLTGGKGADNFIFDDESGLDNIIADFSKTEGDGILIRPGFRQVELRYVEDYGPQRNERGTHLFLFKKADGEPPAASVFVRNTKPSEVMSQLVVSEVSGEARPEINITRRPEDVAAEREARKVVADTKARTAQERKAMVAEQQGPKLRTVDEVSAADFRLLTADVGRDATQSAMPATFAPGRPTGSGGRKR